MDTHSYFYYILNIIFLSSRQLCLWELIIESEKSKTACPPGAYNLVKHLGSAERREASAQEEPGDQDGSGEGPGRGRGGPWEGLMEA